ncbi:MAG: hypothetical protein EX271_00490 [Acidimicrobiales bacterium]|nr:hypothetical protein [Hyphomonadaceae bacterium]RZV44968.1 MAG: hypothetical protein EX271_00490 [Acidimicrobiales bacterium]
MKIAATFMSAACLAALSTAAMADDGPVLKIENFIGTVDVITGDYNEIKVTDADGAPIDRTRSGVTIDGGETINKINCRQNKLSVDIGIGNWGWKKRSGGYKNLNEYPKVKITAPDTTHVVIDNAVIFGEFGTIGSADMKIRSCGDIELANVTGELDLKISGSGDVTMNNAGATTVSVSGSGDLEGNDFASLNLSVSGSGDVEIEDVAGFADISTRGSGDVELGTVSGGLEYRGSGSSNLDVEFVKGDLFVRTSGSGDVNIEDGEVEKMTLRASGSSNIEYDGRAVDAEAYASGSSDIYIKRPSGRLQSEDSAAGDVHIDG